MDGKCAEQSFKVLYLQTPDKLCFILDLMNGGDLHYHLSQHGVFSEVEVLFYASEVILGLEHMHSRYISFAFDSFFKIQNRGVQRFEGLIVFFCL